MKRWIGFILHLAMIVVLTSFGTYTITKKKLAEVPDFLKVGEQLELFAPQDSIAGIVEEEVNPPFLGKKYYGFKEALAFKESQGRYHVVNTLGYLGKYQFGSSTLHLMGVYDMESFLDDPELQEKVFETNIARNKWILRRDIKRFNGKTIGGIKVTESGIIAAAHLAGAGNVKKYLRSYGKEDVTDAYGSSISYYLKKFGGYDISNIEQKQNAKV
ncbi:hypothetical protein [Flagellimonas zhangzhouensis]|uniref:Peptidoglycan-binding protein LysM n=1 Tax=Flagellimonas zhangzhouensis TaxID=1073328 RepID=A0A1H2S0K8_9FLAO|nr:hypothetical protein [Allomuricauda zhangzhouensis]SDQ68816.1 hypothetical protein SAMN05216294_2201 [Allomuricauda zhangzhouensis]SDW24459.1 hypothetical protein SAMN04487892_0849 [Allomuricauda zhangzhouensis]